MANTERLLDLADIIENSRLSNVRFYMDTWAKDDLDADHECGTFACIAGHAVVAAYGNREAERIARFGCPSSKARRILGLTRNEATRLFHPHAVQMIPYKEYKSITPHDAAAVLRHFAATG
ncbi:MAG: hypothetical protein L0241_30620, partial [Planctomycetia bacterium]|nr:hypothetical protein [Planctomycetia bacterium]